MLVKIKENALKNNIPIIQDEALAFIIDKIKINNIKTILEIGTAVGYSAISFAVNDILIDTIERENDLYEKAIDNIAIMNLEDKINIIYADALKYETDKKYDLIFIDGAKSQYLNFFNKYANNLTDKGIIICDNLNFHNLDIKKVKRRTRQLINKIDKFKDFLRNNNDFTTTFYDVGDGLSVSVKNE